MYLRTQWEESYDTRARQWTPTARRYISIYSSFECCTSTIKEAPGSRPNSPPGRFGAAAGLQCAENLRSPHPPHYLRRCPFIARCTYELLPALPRSPSSLCAPHCSNLTCAATLTPPQTRAIHQTMFLVLLTLVVVPLVAGFGTIHDDVRSSPPTYVLKPQLNVSFINFQHVFTNTLISRKQYTMSALGADPACVSHDELGSMVRNAHTAKRLESLAEQIYAGQNAATVMYMLPDEYITTRGTAIFNSACSWPGPRDHASAEPLEGGDGEYLHRVVGTEVILNTLAALSGDAQRYRFTHAFREGLLHIHAKAAIDLKGANLNSNDPAGCATDSSQECFANPMGHMILVDTYQVCIRALATEPPNPNPNPNPNPTRLQFKRASQ